MKLKNTKEILRTFLFILPYICVEFTNVLLLLIDKSISNSIGTTAIIVFSSFITLNWAINTMQTSISSSHSIILAKDRENANKINTNALFLELLFSIIISIILFIFARQITYIYSLENNARNILTIILKLKAIQLPIVALGYIPKNHLKIKEKTNLIWVITVISALVNIIGDLMSVRLGYNEVGIYIATVLSTLVSTVLLFIFNKIKLTKLDKKCLKEIMKHTKDLAFNKIIQRIVNLLYTSVASSLGTYAYAIHCVCVSICETLSEIMEGYYSGLMVHYSNEIQSNKKGLLSKVDLISKYGLFFSIIFNVIILYPLWYILGNAVSWENCVPYIWFYQLEFVATMLGSNYRAYLSANKDTKAIRFVAFIGGICVRIPLVYLFKYLNLGLIGISLVCGIDRIVRAIYLRLYIKKSNWLYK